MALSTRDDFGVLHFLLEMFSGAKPCLKSIRPGDSGSCLTSFLSCCFGNNLEIIRSVRHAEEVSCLPLGLYTWSSELFAEESNRVSGVNSGWVTSWSGGVGGAHLLGSVALTLARNLSWSSDLTLAAPSFSLAYFFDGACASLPRA